MCCVPTEQAAPAPMVGSVIRANTSVCPYAFRFTRTHHGVSLQVAVFADAARNVPTRGGKTSGAC